MKKSFTLTIATLFLAIVMAACSGRGVNLQGTTTPGVFGNGTNAPGLGTTQGASGLGLSTSSAPGTTAQATQPSGLSTTPTQSSGATTSQPGNPIKTAAPTSGATQKAIGTPAAGAGATAQAPGTLNNNQPDAGRLSNLLHFDVKSQDGQTIGKVDDVVLDLASKDVKYIIVGLRNGTSLSSSSAQQVAVPCSLFDFGTQSTTGSTPLSSTPASNSTPSVSSSTVGKSSSSGSSSTNTGFITLKVDQAVVSSAPAWTDTMIPALGQPNQDWDKDLTAYWSQYLTGSTSSGSTTPSQGTGQLQGILLGSQVIGFSVNAGSGILSGQINDLVINPTNCQVTYVVISTSGANNGSFLVPVPPGALSLGTDGKSFTLGDAASLIASAPHFDLNQFPSTIQNGWDKDIQSFWQQYVQPNTP